MLAKAFWWLPLGLFVLLSVFLLKGLSLEPRKIPSELINKPLPTLQLIDSKQQSQTNKMFLGQVTLLHVWASWCLTCRAEHGYLMELTDQMPLHLVGLIYQDHPEPVNQWLSEYGNPYESILFDPQGNFTLALGIYGTPETYLIDKQGIIRYKHIGNINSRTWGELKQQLKRWQEAT